ncbi:hypothetical protein, partial [Mesorhizobium sp.]
CHIVQRQSTGPVRA